MTILGIDPGLATLGYGILETLNGRMRLIQSGAVITRPDRTLPERLTQIKSELNAILQLYRPDEIAFEELFFAKNVTTAINVAMARGVCIAECAAYTNRLYEYTPMQIKQAVVGTGSADKHQVQQMVKLILGLPDIIRPDDAADAAAVCIIHANAGIARDQFRMK